MNDELIKAIANGGASIGSDAAFWFGFWDAIPEILLLIFMITAGLICYREWKIFKKEDEIHGRH